MSICIECGNALIVHEPGPVCLVCQHTSRDSGKAMEAHARGLAAALDATYAALNRQNEIADEIEDELEAFMTVRRAEIALATRMSANIHIRPRPKWAKFRCS